MVDAAIASIIVFLGLFALFGGGVRGETTAQPLSTVEDFVSIISSVPVSSTLDPYYISDLLILGLVPYPEVTPLEEIAYLNFTNCLNCDSHAQNYTLSLFQNTLGPEYGAELIINGTSIAVQTHEQRYQISRTIIFYVRLNDTNLVGPVPAEIRIWS